MSSDIALAMHTLRNNTTQRDCTENGGDDGEEAVEERWLVAINTQCSERMVRCNRLMV